MFTAVISKELRLSAVPCGPRDRPQLRQVRSVHGHAGQALGHTPGAGAGGGLGSGHGVEGPCLLRTEEAADTVVRPRPQGGSGG